MVCPSTVHVTGAPPHKRIKTVCANWPCWCTSDSQQPRRLRQENSQVGQFIKKRIKGLGCSSPPLGSISSTTYSNSSQRTQLAEVTTATLASPCSLASSLAQMPLVQSVPFPLLCHVLMQPSGLAQILAPCFWTFQQP